MNVSKLVTSYRDASDYSIQMNRWFLIPVGAWPSSTSTTIREKVVATISIIICYALIAYTVIPCMLNILLEETDVQKKLLAVGPLNHWCMSGINYFSLLFRSRDIHHCIEHMRTDWQMVTEIADRQVMLKYAKVGRLVAGLCAIFMHGGVFSHTVLQGVIPNYECIGNVSVKVRVLLCPSYSKFVDTTQSPAGEIALALQIISSIVVNSITVGACSLAAVFAMHACGQLNVLMRWLNQLNDRKRQETVQHQMVIIVEHHLRVLSRDIHRCVEHMKTDWRTITEIKDREVMLKYAKVGRFVAGLCAIFMHGGVFSHSVLQGTTPTFEYIGNVSVSVHILPCPSYSKFVDTTQSPAGEIALTLQLISSIVVNSVTVGACSLAAVFAMHACGQLNVLMRWLDQLDDRKQQDTVQHRLAIIVEHHLRVLNHWCMGGMNYFSLLFRSRDIHRCVEHVKTDWRMITEIGDRQVMLKYAKFGRFVAGLCAVFMHGGVFSHSLIQGILLPTFVYIGNVSVSVHRLPCPTYSKFVDITKSPAGEIALIIQLISSIVVNSVTAGACSLAAVFAMHACGQLNILMRWLDQLDDRKQQDMVQHRLAIIVEHHLRVLRINAIVPLMHRIMGSINYWQLLTHNKDILHCILHMETDWKLVRTIDDREVMLRYAKIGRFIAKFCAIFMHSSAIIFTAVKAVKTTTVIIGNETFKMYPMTCPPYSKIVDVRFSPTNEILLSVQLLSTLIVSSSTVAICSLAAVFAMHACGQLNVLHTWLKELTEEKTYHLAERKLAVIVEHHWRVLSAAITQGGQLLYGTARAIKTVTIMVGNETFRTHPITCPTYSKILDTRFSPINEIMLAIQFVSAFAVSSALVSVCSLTGVLAMHVCGQLNVLYTWLNELVIDYEKNGNRSVEQKLSAIVEHHLRALRIMGSINYWVLLQRSDDIHKLIQHMEADWNLVQRIDGRELMLQHAKFGRSVAMICGIIMQGGTFLFSLARALKTTTIIVGNETFTTYPMTCPVYSNIIDTRFSPVNEIALIVQFLSTFIVSSSTVGACSLAAVFAIHACGQLNVLSIWLHELVLNQEKNHISTQRKLAAIVEHHLRILSIVASSMIPCLLYVLFEKDNIKLKLSAIAPLLHRIMGSVHYWVLLKRSRDISNLIQHMEVDWCLIHGHDDREIMLQQAKFGRFVAIICGIIMHGGTILFALAKAMKTATIVVGNETFTTHPMTCPIYHKIIDTRFSPINEIALILQNLAMLVVSTSTVGACSLAAVFAIHACGQLNVLYAWLHELVKTQMEGNDKAKQKLAAIVEHHLRILSIIAIPTIPCLLYVLFEAENIQQKLHPMMPLINRFMSSMHYWVLLNRRDDIQKLIRHMETDWNLIQRIDEREVMLQHAKFGRFITIICGIMLQGGCLLFSFVQSIRTVTITIGNETVTTHTISCPIYSKIIDTRFTPMNEIALVLQNLIVIVVSFCTAGGCSLAAVFAIHACGQLNVLYVWLHELVQNQAKENDETERKLAAIVEHHLRILSSVCKIVILLHIFICSCMIASNMVPCLLYVLFEKENIKLKLSAVGPLLHRVMGSVHYWVLVKRSRDIHKLIRHMETDWYLIEQRLDNREIMLQQAKFGRFLAMICGIIMFGGTTVFSIVKAMKTVTTIVDNETFTIHPLTCPIYSKIIDMRVSPVNEIALILQNLAVFVVSTSTVGACSLVAVFAIHACGQLKVLNVWLYELVENQKKGNDTAERRLAAIVEHHLRILSIIAIPTIPCLLYVFFEADNIKQKLNAIGPLLHRAMGSIHYWVLLKRSSDIHKLIRHMEADWSLIQKTDEREVMLQHAKFGRFVVIICAVFMQGGLFLFSIGKSMKTTTIMVGNETFKTHPTNCPIYSKIIDTRFSPVNEIILVLQNLTMFVASFSTVSVCSLAAVFAIHACGQLNVLYAWLHELAENQKRNDTNRKLAAIVEHHLRTLSLLAVTMIPCLLYVLFEPVNIKQKLSAVAPLFYRIMGAIHYWMLLKRRNDIHKLIQHMETDWNLVQKIDEREVMLQHAKFGRFIVIICAVIMHCGLFLFSIGRSMRTTTIIIGNETFKTHATNCPIYSKIIDTRFSPVNEIALVLQNLTTLVASFSTVGGCSLAAVFAKHASGQLNVLYLWLQELVESKKKINTNRKLAAIVEHHLRVLSFISEVESIMHKVALVELVGSTVVICLLGYYIIMDWNQSEKEGIVAYGIILISVTFNIFIFCYIGEILSEQCGQVGETAYMTNWYLLPGNTALDLVLIILRSSIVVKITAGKMIELSLSTFGNVSRDSFSKEWANSDAVAILTYFILLISLTFNILIFCYIGELLVEECSKVGNTTYKIEWYNLPGKVALDLMLMINMSGHPVQITAGRLLSLSFANFGNVSIIHFHSLSHPRDDRMAKLNISWSNVNSEKDIINALVWNRWILRVLGIWPLVYSKTTMIEKILATISFALCWSALSFLLIPMVIFTLSERTTINDKIKMLGPLSYVLISTLKYFLLVIHHKSIRKCIRVLSTDWCTVQQQDYRKIMIKNVAKSHVLSKFCIMFMYCGGLCFHTVMPFLAHTTIDEQNNTVKPIPYPGFDIIFDLHFMPAYIFVFCAQWFSGIVLFNVTTAVCCLAAMFVAHACGQIEIVMARVENFVKNEQSSHMKQHMAIIVKHHMQILRFSINIDNILREICLVEIVGTTLTICLLEYYCIMEWNNNDSIAILTYFFLLISFVFNVFTLCYIGEQLTNQCSKIGYTSYEIEWYHLPGKIALDLTLIISISHHPIKITAGKMINLSFSCFCSVSTICYHILTVKKHNNKNFLLTYISYINSVIFMYCGGLWFHIAMPFLSHTINEQNVTIKPMPFAGFDNIFNFHFMPVYVFVLCAQWFSGIVLFNVTTAVCCLAAMFVAHACGQIEILIDRVENFIKGAQRNHMKQYMAIIVKHHVQSLREVMPLGDDMIVPKSQIQILDIRAKKLSRQSICILLVRSHNYGDIHRRFRLRRERKKCFLLADLASATQYSFDEIDCSSARNLLFPFPILTMLKAPVIVMRNFLPSRYRQSTPVAFGPS
ncbi:Putative odorant receptor 13a [Cyphomyrmex costatus]|uniref:Putative odorant receptor 13a n=1 Tax=Cyphomyrmex costatus TaxID=456900 RepID=A0A195D1T7_9HYME|nr:Putative odorant receptor 13a [Cyphomyrmex costatus]